MKIIEPTWRVQRVTADSKTTCAACGHELAAHLMANGQPFCDQNMGLRSCGCKAQQHE